MQFLKILIVAVFVLQTIGAQAREGMWIPSLLKAFNEAEMQSMGLKLTAEDIYSVNQSSLKDAIVHFGGGCTAEVISSKGLILTNHHCGYGQIQSHSSVENDLLTNGFWAKSFDEELPNEGLKATFIVRIEDVTKQIAAFKPEKAVSEELRIEQAIASITKKAVDGTHYEAAVKPFNSGNDYYMLVTETFNDVRLVGAPPSDIGKFGGDTDNWMWPRHTGDFSIFRIYASKDNMPADYSAENVPYQPKKHLEINMKGVKEGDFTMVYGFPGRTQEYLPSYAVDYVMNVANPKKIHMREVSLGIMDRYMQNSDKIRIQYAAKYARISNYHKKWIGENRGLKKLNAVAVKQQQEQEFTRLVSGGPKASEYSSILPDFEKAYAQAKDAQLARELFIELYYYGPEVFRFATNFSKLVNSVDAKSKALSEEQQAMVEQLKKSAEGYFKNYNAKVDEELMASMLPLYKNYVAPNFLPGFYSTITEKHNGNYAAYANSLYSNSVFTSLESVLELLNSFSGKTVKTIQKDELYLMATELLNSYISGIKPELVIQDKIDALQQQYVKALHEVYPNKHFYPDANSTLRITYGKVEGYSPADGVNYHHYTTLDGMLAKDGTADDFNVPQKLIDLSKTKEFGEYAYEDGSLRVCFIASNHTTGGNSGSPALDAEGRLIGLNFDRCWEGTMSDIMFDPDRCRNIMVDVKYVLFIVDKFAGAKHLVDEMTLVY